MKHLNLVLILLTVGCGSVSQSPLGPTPVVVAPTVPVVNIPRPEVVTVTVASRSTSFVGDTVSFVVISAAADYTLVSCGNGQEHRLTGTGQQLADCQYALPGRFTTTAQAVSRDGLSASASAQVLVTERPTGPKPPVIEPSAPRLVLSTSCNVSETSTPVTGLTANCNLAGLSYGPTTLSFNDALETNWNWGDGTFSSGQAVSHTFSQPGQFTVVATVRTSYGSTSQPYTVRVGLRP